MTTASELADDLSELSDAATPGPWSRLHDDPAFTRAEVSPYVEGEDGKPHRLQMSAKLNTCDCGQVWSVPADAPVAYCDTRHMGEGPTGPVRMANAALIVALRNNLSAILAALRRVGALEGALKGALSVWDEWGSLDSTDPDDRTAMEAARQALTGEA